MRAPLAFAALLVLVPPLPARSTGHRVDHVGFGLGDLDAASRIVAERTGVEPVYGGEHPDLGTHNALMSLGDDIYLEVIAARPDAVDSAMASQLRSLESLSGVLWAVASDDVARSRETLADAGFATSEPRPGSRVTPAGETLAWETFGITDVHIPGAPFLIHWREGTPHPSTTSPGGCGLAALTITTPAADELSRFTAALALDEVTVVEGDPASISVELDCPTGRVRF